MTKAMSSSTTVAIAYGRLSFDDPSRKTSSVRDQEVAARRYADQKGWILHSFHGDHGITGATMQRPGLQQLLRIVKNGEVDVVIIEDVDRLGRDQEHLQYMAKLLRAFDVRLHAVAIGPVEDLVLAVKGIIAEEQRRRIAYTTRRGLVGKARRAGATGGKTLGYVRAVLGLSEDGYEVDRYIVVEEEAALVRRIFELYATGHSLKTICRMLDAEGIPTPSAHWRRRNKVGKWNPSSLSGNIERGEGILNNRAYVGERIFNRRNWVEVPTEDRGFTRQPRVNDESDWVVNIDPDQRIIPQDLWDAVKARQLDARAARDEKFNITGNPLAGAKRPAHLLTDLVVCGACGEKFIATGGGRWRCRNHRSAACDNGSVTSAELEARTLRGIRERLLTPTLISGFAAEMQKELDRAHQDKGLSRASIDIELADTRARICNLVKQLEEDDDAPRSLIARLKQLEEAEARLASEQENVPERKVVRLPANYAAIYEKAVGELEAHLVGVEGAAARAAIRALIERILVLPGDSRGGKRRSMQLQGDLFGMLGFAERASSGNILPRNAKLPRAVDLEGIVSPLVAGVGFEPTTFRL
ncbi:recombinase family protein, partial [Sphingobium yanoikuyae]|uniref:recombinase family protein n=1 Tax=Sphingobium yanoikuyae TaxID=13690 RepID=UPI0007C7E066